MSINAIFLDRDGALIEDAGYLADPSGVALLPGVGLALKKLKQAGYVRVIVRSKQPVYRTPLPYFINPDSLQILLHFTHHSCMS
jgi:D-glycero-D-manno-heptose 1,7-bisphosphate phosphatase